jgi:hypothetical protein
MKSFVVAVGALATFGALSLSPASAQTLYRSPMYDNSLRGGPAYRGGGQTYYQVPDNSLKRNTLYDSQLQDRQGNVYNCNSLGSCRYRGY